jgi:hypothetical protein
MSRVVSLLLLLSLVQCVIVIGLYWPESHGIAQPSDSVTQLLAPSIAAGVDEIVIGDEHDSEVRLSKRGERWLLPELGSLPADSERIEELLATLGGEQTGWPVASTVAARQRFQVANYHYQRRLTLMANGEELGVLYLGTSPGFRKVHARRGGQDAIFSINLSVFDIPGESELWLDRRLLQIRTPTRIVADGYSLTRKGDHWVSGIGQEPDSRELEALLGALRSLQVEGVASPDMQRELSGTEARLVLEIQSLSGEFTLEFFSAEGEHFIYSSEYALFFRLSDYDYERFTSIDARLLEQSAG